ncbi:hypothetical protein GCM10011581_33670 [Saccharopolyspora subtropica]|uniref:Excreted virulence factor EspC (Type VII ESX diderm) n=1 Tax=Saccharopolyspora thermophila TaxID=89367 RepID=A0A917K1Q9_9PSEU|nr:WXG100 family type VII secretion target [Saccharopolyspora subtropica]GGI93798.1 hypothetical protein GCM10011581_33670 [Saccharopolyspora subtropica]
MTGYHAPPDAIVRCGSNVDRMTDAAKQIKAKATEAQVPELSWGLLGLATTYSSYRDLLDRFQQHLDEMAEGLTKAGADLTAAGKEYRETDESLADMLRRLFGSFTAGRGGGGSW